ncbi:MAG: electron transport complex subunit RsxC [Clostridia bacterium]
MSFSFKKGIHPPAKKELSKSFELTEFKTPKIVHISMSQHIGAIAEVCVAVGDRVLCGSLIGKAKGFVSANVFSSVSGKVLGTVMLPNALGNMVPHIKIENDFKYEATSLPILENPTGEEIVARIQEAGIVGMGGATFPTFIKLKPSKKVDVLIINGAECEPYITCDYRLLLEKTKDVIEGAQLLKKALGVDKCYIGIEENKLDAIKLLQQTVTDGVEIIPLKTKFPQGAEKQLIFAITKRVVPCGKLPMDVGAVVDNVHTAYSTFCAVKLGLPCFMRAMTVSGKGVNKPNNYWVRNGVSYQDIYNECQGGEPYLNVAKVISGGPMMGFSQPDLRVCTTKGSSSLLFLTEDEVRPTEYSSCINCCRCHNACPMNLMPMFIDANTRINNIELANKYGAMNCIECGCCSYVCPANRPLVQSIKLAKKLIKERGIK